MTLPQCRLAGLSRDQVLNLCRQHRWQRLSRAAYFVEGDHPGPPPRRAVIRAALLSAGPAAVAVLETAAEVHGIAGARRDATLHISLPGPRARAQRVAESGLRLHQFLHRPGDVMVVNGMRVTTPVRTVADLLLRVDRYTGVSLLDSALNRHLLVGDDLELVQRAMAGRPGVQRARPWLEEADARAESPLETRVRLRAVDGGVGPDELQFRVHDRYGVVIAIADLAWAAARIVGEADGVEAHDNPTAIFRDRERQNAIVAAGYTPLRFTWPDTMEPATVPRTIRATMSRAR